MPFNYTFRADDIESFDADARDLLENRDRELELYASTIDSSFLNLNADNITSGTVPSSRVTGSYTGITQVGTLTSAVASYSIGDTGPAGGKVFITPSTPGNATGLYFEAAPISTQVQTTWAQFAPINYTTTNVAGTVQAIGQGKLNTTLIINQGNNDPATCAAKYCDDLTYGGFSDWFLPSFVELSVMYTNRASVGGLSGRYWSSFQTAAIYGSNLDFDTGGGITYLVKSSTSNVRAVRSFSTNGLNVCGLAVVRAANTQDGIILTGRAGGTSDWAVNFIPTTLTTNRTLTLPDVSGTMITTGNLSSITATGTVTSGTWSGSFGAVSGANLTSLNASNLASGTVASARISGSYTGITGLGTLETLTIGGAGQNRYITINAPTGYYAIQYFQIGGVYKWHYEVNPAGDRFSLVQTGAAERIGVNSAGMTIDGVGSPAITVGDWTSDASYSAIQTSRGYLLLGRASADDGIYLRSSGASPVHIGQGGNNTMIVGATDVTIAGSLKLSASTNAYVSYANTPDTALPWMQGPTFQGQTGWAFYQQVTGSYRMGFRSGSSGATRYMWCADNTLLGSAPNDAAITTTLNVIGNMRTTAGYYGTVTYGSYGSLSMYGSNNGYVGITFPDQATTWMSAINGQIFGCYRNDNTWNFYVSNGTFVPSDERYKRDIEPLQHGMNLIRGIVPVTYDPLTEDPSDDPEQTVGRTHYGFTTQNILQALTNAGETRDIAMVDIGGPANGLNESDRQYLNHSALIAPMIKAIQELDTRLQQLETI